MPSPISHVPTTADAIESRIVGIWTVRIAMYRPPAPSLSLSLSLVRAQFELSNFPAAINPILGLMFAPRRLMLVGPLMHPILRHLAWICRAILLLSLSLSVVSASQTLFISGSF